MKWEKAFNMLIMPIILTMLMAAALCACTPGAEELPPQPPIENPGEKPSDDDNTPDNPPQTSRNMKITIGSASFPMTLADNAAAAAFRAMLPMTAAMGELNGNEKYYYLPTNLPTSASNPGTIRSGDLMLFGSNCLVLFYKTFPNSYSYTRIGRLDDVSGLEAALGRDGITVKFESTDE